MSLNNIHWLHKFFVEKEINQIYLAVFFMTLADNLITLFVPIYLFGKGFEISSILLFFILISFFFVVFSILGAKIVSSVGMKHAILISTPFLIAYYIGLRFIGTSKVLFVILPLLLALRMVFYNYGFHLNFIEDTTSEKRGRQISVGNIFSAIATLLAPLIAGLIIGFSGFTLLFILGSALLVIGVLPLFLTKDKCEKQKINTKKMFHYFKKKERTPTLLSFTGYAIESIIGRILWPIFLIMLLLTTEKVGLFVTLSLFISIGLFYFIGKLTDKTKNKERLLKIGTALYFFGWIGRIFANTAFKVLFVDSYKGLSEKVLQLPWSAESYNIAAKENYFLFIVGREIIFNISRIIVLPFIIWIFYINFHPFLISFIVASLFTLLYPLLEKTKA